ncbi:TPA: indole-3-glycerol phosphate synthase TrpC [Staphylococcus aureus]|nr:indole-3-glycerol phosphate synthase TrpC [Staphylococcus aureus]
MTLLTRIKTETILLESDIKELIDILISPSIGTDIKYELLSSYSEREIQQQELTYIVRSLINTMYPHQPCYEGAMCVCGTGGDKSNSFNISTTVAFVVASAGVKVIKHGNKSITSNSGSTDLLNQMNIQTTTVDDTPNQLNEKDLVFIGATESYPIMKYMQPVRKMIGKPTILNLVGPLINPYHLTYQMVGVFDPTKLKLVAKTIKDLGRKRAIVLHGANGMDEATLSGDNLIYELTEDGEIKNYTLNATDYGLKHAPNSDFKGGSPEENLAITLNILNGKDQSSRRDVVLLNAGLSLYVAEKVDTMTILSEIVKYKQSLLQNGYYQDKLNTLKSVKIQNKKSFINAIEKEPKLAIIAEIKSKSPTVNDLPERDLSQQISDYDQYGANAVSILTDEKYFDGSFERLQALTTKTTLPVLCKDFIIDPLQIDVAKQAGASMILLIVNILSDKQLKDLYNYAISQNLEVLVEVHDRHELERAYKVNAKLIGVNNRDLKRFVTNVEHTNTILENKKPNHHYISESGIHDASDVRKILHSGIDGLLIGEALMRCDNISEFLPQLKMQKVKS